MWLAGMNCPSLATCNTEAITSSGRAAWRGYDVRNRPVHLRFPDGNGNTDWSYTPDGLPSQLMVLNDAGTTVAYNHYAYNKRRLLTVERSAQPGWYDWPIAYSYNANGHLAGQVWPSGLAVDYAPDALGQATRVGNFASGVRYHANGGIKQFTYGNGIVHSMQQNERQLPERTTDSGVLDFDTRFDPNGNVSDIFDLALGPFYNRHMYYDGLDRLIAAGSNSFGGDYWHRFTYDALDNLKSWTLPGVKDHHYWYDSRNQLTNVRDGVGNTVMGLTYDPQGNLQAKNGISHSFDLGNRLREVTGSQSYRYDALGRRILTFTPGAGSVLSQYAQDGRLVFQSDGPKGLGREFVHLAGSLIAQREYNAAGATITYLHTDALGSPVASSNQAGVVVERTHYEPYGAPIGKVVDGPGYTGHVMDGATGLSYMQQRYMDPQLCVFLSVDPVTAYAKPLEQFNRYRYANGNPYKFTDPDGRIVETAWDVANVAMGVASAYSNFSEGNAGAGVVDSIGAVVDTVAAVLPVVPGGAGTAIKAIRGFEKAADGARTGGRVGEGSDSARREAFEKAGMNDPSNVSFSKVDEKTGTVVEFKGEGGAKIAYDGPHASPGPNHDTQHISWQSAGKRDEGGAQRGNIPYSGGASSIKAGSERLMSLQDSSAVATARKICSLGYEGVSEVSDAEALLASLVDVHGIDSERQYWWESLKNARSLNYGESGGGWKERISALLADMGDPIFIVVTDDEPSPWPVLRIEQGAELVRLLGEMHFFEYFVFSRDCERVFFDTHDNSLIWSP